METINSSNVSDECIQSLEKVSLVSMIQDDQHCEPTKMISNGHPPFEMQDPLEIYKQTVTFLHQMQHFLFFWSLARPRRYTLTRDLNAGRCFQPQTGRRSREKINPCLLAFGYA